MAGFEGLFGRNSRKNASLREKPDCPIGLWKMEFLQNGSCQAGLSHIKAALLRQRQENKGKVFVEFIILNNHKKLELELIKKYDPPWNVSGTNRADCTQ